MLKTFTPTKVVKQTQKTIFTQAKVETNAKQTHKNKLHMLKAVFFGELQEGKRDRRAPRRHYKDQLKRQLAQQRINHQSWQQETSDRESWRSSVKKKASRKFEAERHEAAKKNRRRQKE